MAFATDANITEYTPEIFEHGIATFVDELAKAETDVSNQVKIRYWNNHHTPESYDKTRLTDSQWTKATVYRALSAYILPKLSTFRVDDVFREQIVFYKERFEEEMNTQFALGIEYDHDNDGVVDTGDIEEYKQDRLYR